MYIFELINKFKSKHKTKDKTYVEPEVVTDEIEDASTCNHVFMPIDSTKRILACSKCGYVVKNSKMKFDESDKNPFKNIKFS